MNIVCTERVHMLSARVTSLSLLFTAYRPMSERSLANAMDFNLITHAATTHSNMVCRDIFHNECFSLYCLLSNVQLSSSVYIYSFSFECFTMILLAYTKLTFWLLVPNKWNKKQEQKTKSIQIRSHLHIISLVSSSSSLLLLFFSFFFFNFTWV